MGFKCVPVVPACHNRCQKRELGDQESLPLYFFPMLSFQTWHGGKGAVSALQTLVNELNIHGCSTNEAKKGCDMENV